MYFGQHYVYGLWIFLYSWQVARKEKHDIWATWWIKKAHDTPQNHYQSSIKLFPAKQKERFQEKCDSIIQWLLCKIKYSYRFVAWCRVSACHGIVRPQVTREQNGLQIWNMNANITNEQPRIADREWQSPVEMWWHTVTHGRGSEGETGEWSG